MADLSALAKAISNLNENEAVRLVKEHLDAEVPASDVLAACHKGMAAVGKGFDDGVYFIPDLYRASSLMEKVMTELLPRLEESTETAASQATVVIGTVQDDIHDLGKDIVKSMLQGTGFRVVDLGVRVSPQRFVEAAKENEAAVVGMSVFLTSCCRFVEETVTALKAAGIRDKISIMIGGAAASDLVAERTGCDYYGATAVDGVNHAMAVTKGRA